MHYIFVRVPYRYIIVDFVLVTRSRQGWVGLPLGNIQLVKNKEITLNTIIFKYLSILSPLSTLFTVRYSKLIVQKFWL